MRSVLSIPTWRLARRPGGIEASLNTGASAGVVALVILALVAGLVLGQKTSGLAPDSITYLDMAAQFRAGDGLTHRWAYWEPVYETCRLPTATTMWPPGYALLVAVVTELTGRPEIAAKAVSTIAFGLLAIPLYALARLLAPPNPALIAATAAMCAAPAATYAATIAAESMFVLLFAGSLACAARGLRAEVARSAVTWLAWAGVFAGLSVWLRYVGLAAVAGVVLIAMLRALRAVRMDGTRLLLAGSIPAVLVGAGVLVRERWAGGGRPLSWPGGDDFWASLAWAGKGIVAELCSSPAAMGWPVWLILAIVQVSAVVLLLRSALSSRAASSVDEGSTNGRRACIIAAIAFLAAYALLVFAARFVKGMNIEPRFFTILAPIVMVLLFGAALRGAAVVGKGAAGAAIAIIAVSQVMVSAARLRAGDEGYIAAAAGSPAITWLREHSVPNELLLATRGAELAYHLPNPVLRLPRRPYSLRPATSWDQVDALAARAGARVLVHSVGQRGVGRFDAAAQQWLASLDDAPRHGDRVLMAATDFVIYRVGSGAESAKGSRTDQ